MDEEKEDGDEIVQVSTRVERDTREDWKEYVVESEQYETLSQFVRASVRREISQNQVRIQDEIQKVMVRLDNIEVSIEKNKEEIWNHHDIMAGDVLDKEQIASEILLQAQHLEDDIEKFDDND